MIIKTHAPSLLLSLLLLSLAVAHGLATPRHERVWEPAAKAAFPAVAAAADGKRSADNEAKPTQVRTGGGSTSLPLQYTTKTLQGYYGEISLGSPPQRFRMLLTTSFFPTVWIPNFRYGAANRFYNHSNSQTYHANGTAFSMRGLLTGFLSEDELHIGELTVTRQSFVEVTAISHTQIPPMALSEFDGMLGLGFPTLPNPSQIKMPFHELVDSGALAQPLFALYLNRQAGTSALTLGATNPHHYIGKLAFADVVRNTLWTAKLDDIRVAGQNMTKLRHAQVWVELGLLLRGPADEVAKLAEKVGASLVNYVYMIDCDTPGPDIEVHVGGVSFAFTKSDYIQRNGSTCTWAIQNNYFGTEGWGMGTLFLEKVYTVFHWGDDRAGHGRRMGFALRA